jgi:hypothetical protein
MILLVGVSAWASPVRADNTSDAPRVSWLALERFHGSAWIEEQWSNAGGLDFGKSSPATFFVPRLNYGVTNHIHLQGEAARRIVHGLSEGDPREWAMRVRVGYVF